MPNQSQKPVDIGGQAVLEGVMMKGPDAIAITVRRPDKTMVVDYKKSEPLSKKHKWMGLPIIRGAVNMVNMLAMGIDTLEETLQLLTAGRIDATLNADVSFYDYLNVHPDADFKLVAFTEEASHVAIPLRKGDETATLLEAINNAIEELRADGTLSELGEKYFGQDISSEN